LGVAASAATYAIAGVTLVALFAIGVALSLFTGRGAIRGGFRMLAIGAGAGLTAFLVGRLLGASLA
jgi:VIT1/CCC1 family predicted Fe2+/Mn2+ transporter